MITLGNAAKQLGVSKPTISKAIAKGQLSAQRREDGSFAIDPAELMRWWEGVRHRFQPQPVYDFQRATPSGDAEVLPSNPADTSNAGNSSADVAARLATLEAEVKGMRNLLAEVKQSRDDWKAQAERLTLALPAPEKPAPQVPAEPRPWWRRLAG